MQKKKHPLGFCCTFNEEKMDLFQHINKKHKDEVIDNNGTVAALQNPPLGNNSFVGFKIPIFS